MDQQGDSPRAFSKNWTHVGTVCKNWGKNRTKGIEMPEDEHSTELLKHCFCLKYCICIQVFTCFTAPVSNFLSKI